jgi:hypothetical protein
MVFWELIVLELAGQKHTVAHMELWIAGGGSEDQRMLFLKDLGDATGL